MFSITALAQHALPTRHVRPVVKDGEAKPLGALPDKQIMQLGVMLPLRNSTQLTTLLHQLYDPSSPQFRHFLSVAQFADQFGPTASDYQAISDWAKSKGFTIGKQSANRMLLPITGTVAQVNAAFHVTMQNYQHPTENRTFFAPDREPTVDSSVPLWHISGMDNYSIPRPMVVQNPTSAGIPSTGPGSGPAPYYGFLGSDMRAAYYGGSALTGSGQSVGLLELAGTDLSDLNTYFSSIGQTNNVPIILISTDGASTDCVYSQGCHDSEQTLDMTQALGMAPGLSRLVMYVGNNSTSGATDVLNAMASGYYVSGAQVLDHQLSSSWVWEPADPNSVDPIFQEFQAQGQSYFQAAGDWGSWTTSLLQMDSHQTGRGNVYPADDPYVTSVGGTDLTTNGSGGSWNSEIPWDSTVFDNTTNTFYSTGGGISPPPDSFPIPYWQVTAAAGCSSCSQQYRNGPDISANAQYSFYVCSNQITPCTPNRAGTSFAAPMWAGFMALVNQQAEANGTGPVGFVNPSIYTIAAGSRYTQDFHDITNGCGNVYCAATGFDLVTGLGSPNGQNLINDLAAMAQSAPAPQYNSSDTYSDFSCGNQDAGYNNPCYETLTITFTVESGESLFVNGQQVGLYNNSYTSSQTEYWGSGQCNSYIGQCFGFAPFSVPVSAYATKPGYPNSTIVNVYD